MKQFVSDFRKSNPGLHMLYVKMAVANLATIDKCIKQVNRKHNTSLTEIIVSLYEGRDKLVKEDASYADADVILKAARSGKYEEPAAAEAGDVAASDL